MARNPNNAFFDIGRFGPNRTKTMQAAQGRQAITAAIALNAALSAAIDVGDATVLGVQMPAGWDAAGLYFQVSADGTTFGPLSDKAGTPYAVAVSALEAVSLDREILRPWRYIKVGSGAAGAGVNQTAARSIKLILG